LNKVSEARKAFEQEMRRITGKPPHILTERLIDLIKEIQAELRKQSNGK
jgi:hypothetical protein